MNLFSILSAVSAPKSLWVTLINWIKSSIGNLGWTIILVTLLVKVVTTPLDFFVKLNTKKQTLIQQKCAPQVAKLQKKYGNDRNTLRIQSQSLYKREGLDQRSGCIIMIINLILSFAIFITFYNDLKRVSAYEAINQYEQIEATYNENYYYAFTNYSNTDTFETKQDVDDWLKNYNDMEEGSAKEAEYDAVRDTIEYATKQASDAAVEYWKTHNSDSSWLWIQNIWVADSTAKPFPSYSGLISMSKNTGYTNYAKTINEDEYNKISTLISSNAPKNNNGYYILPILAGLVTFASQYITELHTKLKNKKANKVAQTAGTDMASSMKMMKIIMPVIMVLFVLSASASFGLYILASNVASIALGEITTFAINKMTKKQRLQVEEDLEKEANRMIKKGQIKE